MKVELANPQDIILREIQEDKMPQPEVALTYALCMAQKDEVDFGIVNRAIIERWSKSGLERVKRMAWKYFDK